MSTGEDLERTVERFGEVQARYQELGGYEVDRNSAPRVPWLGSREALAFPEFYNFSASGARPDRMVCTGPVTYKGHEAIKADIANLKAALAAFTQPEAPK